MNPQKPPEKDTTENQPRRFKGPNELQDGESREEEASPSIPAAPSTQGTARRRSRRDEDSNKTLPKQIVELGPSIGRGPNGFDNWGRPWIPRSPSTGPAVGIERTIYFPSPKPAKAASRNRRPETAERFSTHDVDYAATNDVFSRSVLPSRQWWNDGQASMRGTDEINDEWRQNDWKPAGLGDTPNGIANMLPPPFPYPAQGSVYAPSSMAYPAGQNSALPPLPSAPPPSGRLRHSRRRRPASNSGEFDMAHNIGDHPSYHSMHPNPFQTSLAESSDSYLGSNDWAGPVGMLTESPQPGENMALPNDASALPSMAGQSPITPEDISLFDFLLEPQPASAVLYESPLPPYAGPVSSQWTGGDATAVGAGYSGSGSATLPDTHVTGPLRTESHPPVGRPSRTRARPTHRATQQRRGRAQSSLSGAVGQAYDLNLAGVAGPSNPPTSALPTPHGVRGGHRRRRRSSQIPASYETPQVYPTPTNDFDYAQTPQNRSNPSYYPSDPNAGRS